MVKSQQELCLSSRQDHSAFCRGDFSIPLLRTLLSCALMRGSSTYAMTLAPPITPGRHNSLASPESPPQQASC